MTITTQLGWTALFSVGAAVALGGYIASSSVQANVQNQQTSTSQNPVVSTPEISVPSVPNETKKGDARAEMAQIEWQPDFATAQRVSEANDKPVMVVFGASWCGACKMLKKNTLTNQRVIAAAQQWVAVEIDTDKEPALAARYGITSLPTTVFFKGDSKKFGFVGAAEPEDMLNVMQSAHVKIQGAPDTQS